MRTFRCIYVNCFNRLRSAQNCKICTFLDNLPTITQVGNMKVGNMETRQMTPIFSSTFSALTVTFFIWKQSKFILMWSPLWSLLVCKILQFWAKASNSDIILFYKVDTPRLLKIHIMFCLSSGAKKGISSWTSRTLCSFLWTVLNS